MPKPSNRTSVWANLALAASGLIFSLAILEAGLRLAGISFPSFYQEDPDRGGALRPGTEGWFRKEGEAHVRINSDGLRDREHTLAKPPDMFRIAVLGDSFAEAMQVPAEKAFWAVLERELSGCQGLAGRKPEVLNFGVSGYGTAQELLTLRHRVWKYRPDLILLAFFAGNDVRNNSRALNRDPRIPYFVRQDGRLVLDDSYRKSLRLAHVGAAGSEVRAAFAALRNHLRVLQVMSEARVRLRHRLSGELADGPAQADVEPGVDAAAFAPPEDSDWEEAWRVTEALLASMRDEARAHGAGFWIVTVSAGIQVHPDPAFRRAVAKRLGTPDLLYPERRVLAFAERERIPVIPLARPLAEYAAMHRTYLHGFPNGTPGLGHWNENGHRVAGQVIARRLCGQLP